MFSFHHECRFLVIWMPLFNLFYLNFFQPMRNSYQLLVTSTVNLKIHPTGASKHFFYRYLFTHHHLMKSEYEFPLLCHLQIKSKLFPSRDVGMTKNKWKVFNLGTMWWFVPTLPPPYSIRFRANQNMTVKSTWIICQISDIWTGSN